jgi:hypothetical protein
VFTCACMQLSQCGYAHATMHTRVCASIYVKTNYVLDACKSIRLRVYEMRARELKYVCDGYVFRLMCKFDIHANIWSLDYIVTSW